MSILDLTETFSFGKYKGFVISKVLGVRGSDLDNGEHDFDTTIVRRHLQRYFEFLSHKDQSDLNIPVHENLNISEKSRIELSELLKSNPKLYEDIDIIQTNDYIIVESRNSLVKEKFQNFILSFLQSSIKPENLKPGNVGIFGRKPLKIKKAIYKDGKVCLFFTQTICNKEYTVGTNVEPDDVIKLKLISPLEIPNENVDNIKLNIVDPEINGKPLNIEISKHNNIENAKLVLGKPNHYFVESPEYDSLTKDIISELGDSSYIFWCIKNVDFFSIDPTMFSESIFNYSIQFNSELIEEGLIKYSLTIEEKEVLPNDEILELNRQKYNSKMNNNDDDYYNDDDYNHPFSSDYYNDSLDVDQQSPDFWDDI